ncbi:MAG TPA: DNA gyrase modulator, partial [Candidatus Limnocylindria bacterium]|nr:DNA gyrase modulator [Candidatus Limnocylindria bacterium]
MVVRARDRDEVLAPLQRALRLVEHGEAEALYTARNLALTRFANSRIHQNVAERDAVLRIRIVHDGRTGVASTNRLDDEGLRAVVERAEAIRLRAAPNPEQAVLPERDGEVDEMAGFAPATAGADPELRAAGAQAVVSAGQAAQLEVSGAFSTEATTVAVANSLGVSAMHTTSQAKLVTVMMGDNGASGYAQASGSDVERIDPTAVGEEAADKAIRSAGAGDLEPGEYQ